jgi:curved DNA-binding protein CbpA
MTLYRTRKLTNRGDDATARQRFQNVLAAYEVLREPGKRAQYDLVRSAGFNPTSTEAAGFTSAWPRHAPGGATSDASWERAFDEWERRMKEEFGGWAAESETMRQEREHAQRRARAEAWEREKAEASFTRERVSRLKRKTEAARAMRHAMVLRRFWQTHSGITKWDVAVVALFLGTCGGVAFQWRSVVGINEEGAEEARVGGDV